jgi:hypothetical protein
MLQDLDGQAFSGFHGRHHYEGVILSGLPQLQAPLGYKMSFNSYGNPQNPNRAVQVHSSLHAPGKMTDPKVALMA